MPTLQISNASKHAGYEPTHTQRRSQRVENAKARATMLSVPNPANPTRNAARTTQMTATRSRSKKGNRKPIIDNTPPPPSSATNLLPSVKATGAAPELASERFKGPADPAAEMETRVEIGFARFEAEVLDKSLAYSKSTKIASALRRFSRLVALGTEWNEALAAYKNSIFGKKFPDGSFPDVELKCLELLNLACTAGRDDLSVMGEMAQCRTPLEYVRREEGPSSTPVSRSSGHYSTSPFTLPSNPESEIKLSLDPHLESDVSIPSQLPHLGASASLLPLPSTLHYHGGMPRWSCRYTPATRPTLISRSPGPPVRNDPARIRLQAPHQLLPNAAD